MNRQVIIIVTSFILILFIISSLFLLLNNDQKEATGPTGGSGMIPVGSLVLYGYDTPSNNNPPIPVGTFFSVDQQAIIKSTLEEALFKISPQREYRGDIVTGTVEVDVLKSVITFDVKIENPSMTYTVSFNTLTNEITIIQKETAAAGNN